MMKLSQFPFVKKYQNTPFVQSWLQIKRSISNTKEQRGVFSYFYIHKAQEALTSAKHTDLQTAAKKLIKKSDSLGHFYLAKSEFLLGEFEQAKSNLSRFLAANPNHIEAIYLLAEIHAIQGDKTLAWSLLEGLLTYSKRGKTWQHLSNLVEMPSDFERYCVLFEKYFPEYLTVLLPFDLASHLSNAAIRAGNTDFALDLWRRQYRLSMQVKNIAKPTASKQYTDEKAAIALSALKNCLDGSGIEFFLISGTLLGCIREGKLLGHDKDIDVGVWDDYGVQDLASVVRRSGCFYVLPIYSPDILVVRHVSGITIDIFIHYREPDDYWHAGGKTRWHNSPFELAERAFLGNTYLIPKDYHRYLTENYGADWQTPKIEFDSAMDTPNVEILSQKEFIIYLYKKTLSLTSSNRQNRYIGILKSLGENI
ncbi:tetratricopeptide repeat protein [Neisseria animalis]|nr:capZB protein [Neisseria animalis]VEE07170.1 LPS biosynthesis protein [Neisseria animalis]